MNRLLNFALFYLGWFACVAGAGSGLLWLGPAVVGAVLLFHLSLASRRAEEGRLIVSVGLLGFAVDTALASAGVYAFTGTSATPWLCPPWMMSLWMLFAITLDSSMGWLAGRFRLSMLLGALFGPLSYLAGARLGAIEIQAPMPVALTVIGIAWAAVMPALLWLRASRRTSPAAVALAAALIALVTAPRTAAAAEIEGVNFADEHRLENLTLDLHCVGLLRYKVVFKGYVAGLYLAPGVEADRALDDVPKRLELSYFWGIDADDFGRVGDEILERNVDARTLEQLRPRLQQINALYQTVQPGDRYALTYVPGRGTDLELNGRRLGTVPGADFAAAYFRIWLGDEAIDAALRDQLLACPA
jgi:hypothetical protein